MADGLIARTKPAGLEIVRAANAPAAHDRLLLGVETADNVHAAMAFHPIMSPVQAGSPFPLTGVGSRGRGLAFTIPLARMNPRLALRDPRIAGLECHGNQAEWTLAAALLDPDGAPLADMHQHWRVADVNTALLIDGSCSLIAKTPLVIPAGLPLGLWLTPAYAGLGQVVVDAQTLDAGDKRGKWAAVSAPAYERTDWAGIALLDHPANPGHPAAWRVETDHTLGIINRNPLRLEPAKALLWRYRLVVFSGMIRPLDLTGAWEAFARK